MIAVLGVSLVGAVVISLSGIALRRRHRAAMTRAYLEGVRDGVAMEAKMNHASAKIMRVPLSGRN